MAGFFAHTRRYTDQDRPTLRDRRAASDSSSPSCTNCCSKVDEDGRARPTICDSMGAALDVAPSGPSVFSPRLSGTTSDRPSRGARAAATSGEQAITARSAALLSTNLQPSTAEMHAASSASPRAASRTHANAAASSWLSASTAMIEVRAEISSSKRCAAASRSASSASAVNRHLDCPRHRCQKLSVDSIPEPDRPSSSANQSVTAGARSSQASRSSASRARTSRHGAASSATWRHASRCRQRLGVTNMKVAAAISLTEVSKTRLAKSSLALLCGRESQPISQRAGPVGTHGLPSIASVTPSQPGSLIESPVRIASVVVVDVA